jgi:hypothetical protein
MCGQICGTEGGIALQPKRIVENYALEYKATVIEVNLSCLFYFTLNSNELDARIYAIYDSNCTVFMIF